MGRIKFSLALNSVIDHIYLACKMKSVSLFIKLFSNSAGIEDLLHTRHSSKHQRHNHKQDKVLVSTEIIVRGKDYVLQ